MKSSLNYRLPASRLEAQMRSGLIAALAIVAFSASAAQAGTAIYTISGHADGSLNGVNFTNAGFSFTKDTHHADVGPLHMSVAERENVNIPQWAGFGAMLAWVLLLVVPFKKT